MRIKKRKFRKRKIYPILEFLKDNTRIIFIVLIIAILFASKKPISNFVGKKLDSENQKNCPSKILGNMNSNVKIKYFESPYCPACWMEEIFAFPKLFKKMNDSFFMEKYDIRFCKSEVKKYAVFGTPTFVFQNTNTSKEFVHYGYYSYSQLRKMINSVKRLK